MIGLSGHPHESNYLLLEWNSGQRMNWRTEYIAYTVELLAQTSLLI
jgi:hypothetical protein